MRKQHSDRLGMRVFFCMDLFIYFRMPCTLIWLHLLSPHHHHVCLSTIIYLPSSLYLSIYLSICLSVYLSIHLSIYLSLPIYLSTFLHIDLPPVGINPRVSDPPPAHRFHWRPICLQPVLLNLRVSDHQTSPPHQLWIIFEGPHGHTSPCHGIGHHCAEARTFSSLTQCKPVISAPFIILAFKGLWTHGMRRWVLK